MNEREVELLETLEALLEDLNAAGYQFVLALTNHNMKDLHVFRTGNHAVSYALVTMLERQVYNDLADFVDGGVDDQS